jgi:nucleoside-diphosphate-sugar epimerase
MIPGGLLIPSGISRRVRLLSSCDVYRAWGRFHRTEPGEPEPLPLSEESPLRSALGPEGAGYDKVGVETVLREAPAPSVTVIRYPAVYGPGDGQRRFEDYVIRMAAGRESILMGAGEASFRFSHGYSENVAHAVVLAATSDAAAGRTYNVVERNVPSGLERVRQLASVLGWPGEVVVVPDEIVDSLTNRRQTASPDFRQDYVLDDGLIRRELGYEEVVSYEEGLRRTATWLQSIASRTDQIDYSSEDAVLARWRSN